MVIDLQFILFLLIALWLGTSEMILEFFGYDPDKVSLFFLIGLWLVIIFAVSVVLNIIFRTSKTFFRFLLDKRNKI